MAFTVDLSSAGAGRTTVDYATGDGTADDRRQRLHGRQRDADLQRHGGRDARPSRVSHHGRHQGRGRRDVHREPERRATAARRWRPATSTLRARPATGTIQNDDTATLSIGNVSVAEGGNLVFTVTLSNAVPGRGQGGLRQRRRHGHAADSDYTAASGTLTFSGTAGETQTITVATTADTKVEADETLTVTPEQRRPAGDGRLGRRTSAPRAARPRARSRTTTRPRCSIGNVSVAEGGNLVFTVDALQRRAGRGEGGLRQRRRHGHARPTATTRAASGTLTFSGTAGETQTITVATTADTKVEADETLTVSLEQRGPAGQRASPPATSAPPAARPRARSTTTTRPRCRSRQRLRCRGRRTWCSPSTLSNAVPGRGEGGLRQRRRHGHHRPTATTRPPAAR